QFNSIEKASAAYEAAVSRLDQFNKGSFAKLINYNPDKAFEEVFAAKDSIDKVDQLLRLTAGDPAARTGLKVAYKDWVVKEVETARGDIIKQAADRPTSLAETLDKTRAAAQRLFADEPEKLRAL